MPIIIFKKLILVEAKQLSFTGKKGDIVKKWKYTFLNSSNELVVGYDDIGFYKDHVQVVSGWEASKAQDYSFELKEYRGQTKEKLVAGSLKKEHKK